jgi:hypothetical protein
MDHSRAHLKTENVEQRTTEDLISEMTKLLSTIKTKYSVYVQAE